MWSDKMYLYHLNSVQYVKKTLVLLAGRFLPFTLWKERYVQMWKERFVQMINI